MAWLKVAVVCGAMLACIVAQEKPNIVWIFADDYGFNDIGFRNSEVISPNLDALAKSGVILTNAYTAPQCSPSRGSLMSGRYSYKSRMQHSVILDDRPCCLALGYKLLPGYLKELGYQTHAVGKWHLGYCINDCIPTSRGFDTFSGGYSGEGHMFSHITTGGAYDWHIGNVTDFGANGTHTQVMVQNDFDTNMDNWDGSTPFFYYVAFHNVHSPLEPTDEFLKLYEGASMSESRKKYLALVSGMDSVVSAIVQKLKDVNAYENTWIFFSSDNGGDTFEGDNSPYRGVKGSLWEGGCKANAFIHSPMLKETGIEHDGLVHITDWLPTIVKLAGGSVPESDGIDGLDQTDLVLNNGPSVRKNMVYNIDREYDIGLPKFGEIAVRNEQYKLIWGNPGQGDGWGVKGADFIYNMDYYKDYVAAHSSNVVKRGGPYKTTAEQSAVLNGFMEDVKVVDELFNAGEGYMHLFDLYADPSEKTNLINSTDADHVAAKAELIKFVQDSYKDGYLPQTKDCWVKNENILTDGALFPGWCEGKFPTTSDGS